MTLPKELTTVTPLSKYLALSLFVLLPILAFFLGIRYQSELNIVDKFSDYQSQVQTPSRRGDIPLQEWKTVHFPGDFNARFIIAKFQIDLPKTFKFLNTMGEKNPSGYFYETITFSNIKFENDGSETTNPKYKSVEIKIASTSSEELNYINRIKQTKVNSEVKTTSQDMQGVMIRKEDRIIDNNQAIAYKAGKTIIYKFINNEGIFTFYIENLPEEEVDRVISSFRLEK